MTRHATRSSLYRSRRRRRSGRDELATPAILNRRQPATPVQLAALAAHLRRPGLPLAQRQALLRTASQTYGNQAVQRALYGPDHRPDIQRQGPGISSVANPPQATFAPATTMGAYISLVQELERSFPGYDPRQMLALLRQVYYGKPWSVSRSSQWSDVLPQSPDMPDPRGVVGTGPGSLYHALQSSQEVAGTDVGHVLTGLEALLDPTAQVEIEITGPNLVVGMPNTEFATWGGDLGSAAGQAVADRHLGRTRRSDPDYFADLASSADLEGDLDAYVIQHGARHAGGLAGLFGAAGHPGGGLALSEVLRQYYLDPASALGSGRANRYRIFAAAIGCRINGRQIANRRELQWPIAMRVADFAFAWFMKEYRGARGTLGAIWLTGPGLNTELRIKALAMTSLFFDWLEARM